MEFLIIFEFTVKSYFLKMFNSTFYIFFVFVNLVINNLANKSNKKGNSTTFWSALFNWRHLTTILFSLIYIKRNRVFEK